MKLNNGETTSLAFGGLHLHHLCVWKAAAVFVVGSPFYLSEHTAIEKSRQRKKERGEKKASWRPLFFSNKMERAHCSTAQPSPPQHSDGRPSESIRVAPPAACRRPATEGYSRTCGPMRLSPSGYPAQGHMTGLLHIPQSARCPAVMLIVLGISKWV